MKVTVENGCNSTDSNPITLIVPSFIALLDYTFYLHLISVH